MPDPLHVLIVEDSPKDAELLLLELSKAGYLPDWKRVDTEAAYVDSLHPGLDLILSDQTMPQFNGLRALELLKRRGLEIPFILISGTVGEESAVAAMKLGVTDYLLRDRLARLGTAVGHALEKSQVRRERKKELEALKESEERCQRAQRMESIGALANGIAHDLNNILSPIMTAVETLKSSSTDPETLRMLETIEANARRGSDAVRQILSFGPGLEGEQIEVQPKHLIKDIEGIIKGTFPKEIRLQISVQREPWPILGFPMQLHQILLNLCVNARDAMPEGGVLTIRVANRMLDDSYVALTPEAAGANPGPHLELSVSDSGEGIEQDEIDRIFDPFFSPRGAEASLGLPTVLALVKAHGGFIVVESEPGTGTTFRLFLPAMPASEPDKPVVSTLPRGDGETVLIIDDESSVITVTRKTLEEFGYRVLSASNGAEAVAVYAQHQGEIALVLTDMLMPVMNGSATIQALVQINPAVKIIVVSGMNGKREAHHAEGPGVAHFLHKPFTARSLLEKVRATLEEENAEKQGRLS